MKIDSSALLSELIGCIVFFTIAFCYSNPIIIGFSLFLGLIVATYINQTSQPNYLNPIMVISQAIQTKMTPIEVLSYFIVQLIALYISLKIKKMLRK